ncbi:phage tail tape measure protein [Clostridium estertheticum]|uniref:phage tail tape measure protein n=1 Tax=Clostridium estertheticum TaxID=238834 RepID=UPI00124EDE59|nr:phage tail tape measure protein [Clostridium estertheticum]MBZ9616784.1 phage tail tape measure protein [Clostridium estertheticum subsp. laramiense]WAG72491.1 phage tail tape measure protein [Clostridium estertheticum]
MDYGIKTQLDLNSLKQVTAQFEGYLKQLQKTADSNVIKIKMESMNNSINQTTQGLQNMNTQSKSFGENMQYAIGRVAQFAIGMSAVYGVVKLVKDGIQEIVDINTSDVNIAMITGDSIANVQKMNDGYLDMANSLKVLNSEVLSGAESWLRSGVNIDTANANLETTTKLSKIANVSNGEMADSLIIIANQYKLNSTELEAYASKVALLDNTSATSSEKINSAMQYSAETFKSTGINMNDALAMVTNYSEKSAQSGEAIGRGFRSMLLNFQKMKAGFKSGDATETGAVNNLETLLNSKGIALRKSKDQWVDLGTVIQNIQKNMGKFTSVQKSQLSFLIGGKEQAEMTSSTLNNMTRINELKDKIGKDDGGKALNTSYAKYMQSVKATQAELKNTLTGLYTKTINSSELQKGIQMLIQVVKFTEFLITDNKALIASYVGIVLVIKNFGALTTAIGTVKAMLSLLKTEGIGALAVLEFNPVILAITVLTAVVGGIVLQQYNHKQEVIKLKDEYVALDKAMKEMDSSKIKEQTTDIKKQQDELTKLAKASKSGRVTGMGDIGDKDKQDLADYIKELEDAGFHVDKVTNKIVDLQVAQSNINTSDNIKKIQDKNAKTIEETSATQSLIQQYQNLDGVENKSADQKTILSNLSKELVGKVDGLTTSTDKNGNMVITNTGFLGKQVTALDLLKQQSTITANIQIDNAIKTAQVMKDGTIMTLESMVEQLAGYKALNTALASTDAGKKGFFGAITAGNDMGITSLQKSIDDINALKSSSEIKAPALLGDSTDAYKANTDATDDNTKSKDKNSEATDKQEEATNRLKISTDAIALSTKNYDTALRAINLQMKEQDSAMSKLNVHGKEYIEGLDKKQKILQATYDLTEKQMNLDSSAVAGVSALEGKAVATSSGNAIVEQAKKYLGTPYVWGGEY